MIIPYSVYDSSKKMFSPLAESINFLFQNNTPHPADNKILNAHLELLHRFIKDYPRQHFELGEEVLSIKKDYCVLKNITPNDKPPLLIIAPLSGHYATLLRDTVNSSINDYNVYITDWINCRDVPFDVPDFGFDTYVEYLIDFFAYLKNKHGDFNCLAVCQPTVPALVASAYVQQNNLKINPEKMVLIGGPVDARINPTEVNKYASSHSLDWFRHHVIDHVPIYYQGSGRLVYPGFLQHLGFVAMNFYRHAQSHLDFFNQLVAGADLDAHKHRQFYNEYNAVMDLSAEYYLDTLKKVFHEFSLPKGKLVFNDTKINLKNLRNMSIMVIEGEKDDISGIGQTRATLKLTTGITDKNKEYLLASNVGHYGLFAGSAWRNQIYPQINAFLKAKKLFGFI